MDHLITYLSKPHAKQSTIYYWVCPEENISLRNHQNSFASINFFLSLKVIALELIILTDSNYCTMIILMMCDVFL